MGAVARIILFEPLVRFWVVVHFAPAVNVGEGARIIHPVVAILVKLGWPIVFWAFLRFTSAVKVAAVAVVLEYIFRFVFHIQDAIEIVVFPFIAILDAVPQIFPVAAQGRKILKLKESPALSGSALGWLKLGLPKALRIGANEAPGLAVRNDLPWAAFRISILGQALILNQILPPCSGVTRLPQLCIVLGLQRPGAAWLAGERLAAPSEPPPIPLSSVIAHACRAP
mmetsp:Transcript_38025/g.120036  ORF Transcript_38025/g.120036 Transcript_38025/m.120036 type:complete len:226 (+) Transcript_38025:409-1086(+)